MWMHPSCDDRKDTTYDTYVPVNEIVWAALWILDLSLPFVSLSPTSMYILRAAHQRRDCDGSRDCTIFLASRKSMNQATRRIACGRNAKILGD